MSYEHIAYAANVSGIIGLVAAVACVVLMRMGLNSRTAEEDMQAALGFAMAGLVAAVCLFGWVLFWFCRGLWLLFGGQA
tara:strand:+ start:644 stop:880 length:237 start_codon:yes stop_codon:yes gene_type:complete